ncbi:hypothetical protein BHE74_00055411, partial [Ensete ventricosum]
LIITTISGVSTPALLLFLLLLLSPLSGLPLHTTTTTTSLNLFWEGLPSSFPGRTPTMGLEIVDVRQFPPLPAVRTTGMGDKPVAEGPSGSGSEGEVECSTPKSEEHEPKPAMVCPPAPRKPRPAKRKLGPPPKGYYPVPSDLASVFVPLSRLRNKRIRVGSGLYACRTKLKQIEVDYECLKKWCESLSDENRRLKKELQELRSANPGSPFYMHLLKAATLTICPSCERMAASGGGAAGKSTIAFDGMKGQLVPVRNGHLSRLN